MLELLQRQTTTATGYCPGDSFGGYVLSENTGPGPKCLIGAPHLGPEPGMIAGFFGEVPVEDLISGVELASLIGLTAGWVHNSTEPWLKFLLDDTILFFAKKSYRYNSISWNNINSANAVYGNRVVEIGGYRFRIRLPRGVSPEYQGSYPTSTSHDHEATWGSEWNRLLYPISEDSTNPDRKKLSQTKPNWVSYSPQEIGLTGNGRNNRCQETHPTSTSSRVNRGNQVITQMTTSSASGTGLDWGWRPVLEFIVPELHPP